MRAIGRGWIWGLLWSLLAACGPVIPIAVLPLEVSRPDLEIIAPENVSHLQEINRWGRGRMLNQALSPDGKLLAVVTTNGVYYYNATTLEETEFSQKPNFGPSEQDAIVTAIAFSSDGRFIAYATLDGTYRKKEIQIISMKTGDTVHVILYPMINSQQIESLQFSPDGNFLLVGSLAGGTALYCESGTRNIALYRIDDSFPLYNQYHCFYAKVTTRFTLNNQLYIFTEGEQPSEMVVIETSTGNRLKKKAYEFNYSLDSESVDKIYDVSADGLTLAAMQFTANGLVYKLLNAKTLEVLEITDAPVRFSASPKYRWIDHHVEPWELQTMDGKPVCKFDLFFGLPSLFTPDGQTGLSFGTQEINLWDLSTCKSKRTVLATTGIQDFAVSPNGQIFAYQDLYNFYLQDARSGKILASLSKPRSLDYDNQRFAFSFGGGKVYVSNKQTDGNYKVAELDAVTGEVGRFLAYDAKHLQRILVPNHERILFIENKRVELWNLITDKQIKVDTDAWGVVLSPNRNEMLAIAEAPSDSQYNELVRVDLHTGETIDVYSVDGVRDVQYISDTLAFVTQHLAHNQENYAILNLETGEIESQLEQPPDSEYGYQGLALTGAHIFLTFDNKYSHNYEGWIQMRSVKYLSEMKILGKISDLGSLLVSPDQRILVSVSREFISWGFNKTVVQFWDAQTGELLAEREVKGVSVFTRVHFSADARYIVLEDDGLIRLWGVPHNP